MNRLSIRTKLLLLAGLPVLGALALCALIALGALRQAQDAAALGSVEDVARLSQRISEAIDALQTESARSALAEGTNSRPEVVEADRNAVEQDLRASYKTTDAALADLLLFLKDHDTSKLPSRLARDVTVAQTRLSELGAFRARMNSGEVPIEDILEYYGSVDDALIGATGALTQLSDDGELLRSIWSFVAMAKLTERGAREHALLSYVFSSTQFPPGSFKAFVTLVTEERVYEDAFASMASETEVRRYRAGEQTEDAKAVLSMRNKALETTDDTLAFDANVWFRKKEARLQGLRQVEDDIVNSISTAATAKAAATRSSIQTSTELSLFVILSSAIMAWAITRGLTRAVGNLSRVAELVRTTKDYGVRAEKTTGDEIGVLTDAFNEMLSDIQGRDTELQDHRNNLETMVSARTAELVCRNEAMRLVLDNVDQGLATVNLDGTLDRERSIAFDSFFGAPSNDASIGDALAKDHPNTNLSLAMAWTQIAEDVLPIELSIEQFPTQIMHDGKHFTLRLKPIVREKELRGALLIVTDVTAEQLARGEQERQREYIAVFERVMSDKDGFAEFSTDTARILARLVEGATEPGELMRLVHTIKGNAAQWGVSSVSKIAHELESQAVLGEQPVTSAQVQELCDAWEALENRFRPLLGGATDRISITRDEMRVVLAQVRARAPHDDLLRRIGSLTHESVAVRFERMALDLERLAVRLDKPVPTVIVDSNDVRLPASRFSSFWQSTVHVLRNLMDHGIESEAERIAHDKVRRGTVTLRSSVTRDRFRIEFEDDGRGIDWAKIAIRAKKSGLPYKTQKDLERAIFAAGVSTADQVSDLSGRGVGLSAVEERCVALGGKVWIESTHGAGTRLVAEFPRRGNEDSIVPGAMTRVASETQQSA